VGVFFTSLRLVKVDCKQRYISCMRRPIIVGNWKMNMLIATANKWVEELLGESDFADPFDVVVAPPFTALAVVRERIKGSRIQLAGQNMGLEVRGARTGEVSAVMLKDAGCDYVILGHSERRQHLAETDGQVNRKIFIACEHGLDVIFCVGESIEDRDNGRTNKVVERQLSGGLERVGAGQFSRLSIAYEPVWAIGTGHTASPNQAQDVHGFIRAWCEKSFGTNQAAATRILYGGSVDPQNSPLLMTQSDIDGLLVGGASLKSKSFYDIINSSFESGD